MLPDEVAKKIKNFEIQGSEISKYAIESFRNFCMQNFNIEEIEKAKEILYNAKKSDAVMRNCIALRSFFIDDK